jgi:hypothetical protein
VAPRRGPLNEPDQTGAPPSPTRYELHIRGRLGETVRSAFQGFTAESREGRTVLTGVLRDQAALHGALAQVEALGLELLELRRLPPS